MAEAVNRRILRISPGFGPGPVHVMVWTGRERSLQGLATGWTVQGSNPVGGEIFCTRPDRPWSPPSLLHNGYSVSFLR
jgi:hypothetical protein